MTIGEDRVQAIIAYTFDHASKTHRLVKDMHSGKTPNPPLKNVSAFAHSRRPLELWNFFNHHTTL